MVIGTIKLALEKPLNCSSYSYTPPYYVKSDEWEPMLEEALEIAISDASVEVRDGVYTPFQLTEMVDRTPILMTAQQLLALTYSYSIRELPTIINEYLTQLPGGEDWKFGRR